MTSLYRRHYLKIQPYIGPVFKSLNQKTEVSEIKIRQNKTMQQIDRSREKQTPQRERQRQPVQPFRVPKSDQELIDKIFNQSRPEWHDLQTGFAGGPKIKRQNFELIIWSWLASLIDGLVIIAASCFFVISVSFLMRTSVSHLLKDFFIPGSAMILFLQLFAITSWIYMVVTRSFMGYTFGEMSCDVRLGQPHERLHISFIPKVILRQSMIVFSGLFFFPVLSLISGRDIVGYFTGLKLYSLK